MLTPEEKKEIREMAKMAHSWDVHVSNKGYSFDFTKNTRDAYASGMEAGILKERERLLPLIEKAFDHARANRFSSQPNKVWEQFKTENNL